MIIFKDCIDEQQKTFVGLENIEELFKIEYFEKNETIKKTILAIKMVIHGTSINLSKANKQENLLEKICSFIKEYNKDVYILERDMKKNLENLGYEITYSGKYIDKIKKTEDTKGNIRLSDL